MSVKGDRVLRAMTGDQAFRVIAAVTDQTVRGAAKTQGAEGDAAGRLGDVMTGAILLREAMSPGHRLQIVLRDAGGGTVVGDAHPDGVTRGLVNPGSKAPLEVGVEASLQVARTLANGELHQGIVAVPENGTVSTALMRYLQESEQVYSVVAVHTLVSDAGITASGGYLVQLMPDAEREGLAQMTEVLGDAVALDELLERAAGDAGALLTSLLGDTDVTPLGDSAVKFGCTCSEARILGGLATLDPTEIRDMVDAGELLEIRCDACGRRYEIDPKQLAPLVKR